MIPEPQRTYLLELLSMLGPAADDFVIAGAQAIKFTVQDARGTKDVDFILNVIALRTDPLQLDAVLKQLGGKRADSGKCVSDLINTLPAWMSSGVATTTGAENVGTSAAVPAVSLRLESFRANPEL